MKNKLIRMIALSSIFAAILFAQEELLTFIPGVQFTFLLIIVYGAFFKLKWGTLIIMIHVLLDNLIMGSFIPQVIIPMFLGLEITLIIGYLLRNKPLWYIVIGGFFSIIIYTQLFALSSVIFYKIPYLVYLAEDILFTAILLIFTVLSLMWLYKPLIKALNNLKEAKSEKKNGN